MFEECLKSVSARRDPQGGLTRPIRTYQVSKVLASSRTKTSVGQESEQRSKHDGNPRKTGLGDLRSESQGQGRASKRSRREFTYLDENTRSMSLKGHSIDCTRTGVEITRGRRPCGSEETGVDDGGKRPDTRVLHCSGNLVSTCDLAKRKEDNLGPSLPSRMKEGAWRVRAARKARPKSSTSCIRTSNHEGRGCGISRAQTQAVVGRRDEKSNDERAQDVEEDLRGRRNMISSNVCQARKMRSVVQSDAEWEAEWQPGFVK